MADRRNIHNYEYGETSRSATTGGAAGDNHLWLHQYRTPVTDLVDAEANAAYQRSGGQLSYDFIRGIVIGGLNPYNRGLFNLEQQRIQEREQQEYVRQEQFGIGKGKRLLQDLWNNPNKYTHWNASYIFENRYDPQPEVVTSWGDALHRIFDENRFEIHKQLYSVLGSPDNFRHVILKNKQISLYDPNSYEYRDICLFFNITCLKLSGDPNTLYNCL